MDGQQKFINKVGYSEMYEWAKIPDNIFGVFVTFDDREPNKIIPTKSASDSILGITTIQSTVESDNPDHWKYSYLCNEVGDRYLKKERIGIGVKEYDQVNELSYIHTMPMDHFVEVHTPQYDKDREYVPRTARREWVRVNLIGKVIVLDNGECKPGEWCEPYTGKEKKNFGHAVPADFSRPGTKFYVLQRLTEKSIEIVMSPTLNKFINSKKDE